MTAMDVNEDGYVTARDALAVINILNDQHGNRISGEPIAQNRADVNLDGEVTSVDALRIINHLNVMGNAEPALETLTLEQFKDLPKDDVTESGVFETKLAENDRLSDNLLTAKDVEILLSRASMATESEDAIIAVVDRSGRILGVRVEDGVSANLKGDDEKLAFAIDGAVAKARTAAFFSSNAAPLTSRTIRFISQSTNTQREVESSPQNTDPNYQGPGLVAPIGVGGHFPPEIPFTPQVDLFAIEHQSRDSQTHPGEDRIRGTADDFELQARFNADPAFIPEVADDFFRTWPESFGEQSGTAPDAVPRGIATLPGGIPLYKQTKDKDGKLITSPTSQSVNLVGGIGVFFPGEDGYATFEQGFEHGVGQTEKERTNADKVLEAEFAAFVAAAGGEIEVGMSAFDRDLTEFENRFAPLPEGCEFNFVALSGRIDLVGLTLEIYGPTPSPQFPVPGIDRLLQFGRQLGGGIDSGDNVPVGLWGEDLNGKPVPEGWLVVPHDSPTSSGLTAEDVQQIIETGIAEAERTRAAIRLDIDGGFRPGETTSMVLSVADTNGELLGLYRMPDATIFSIDVAVAKARNTAYYADPEDIQFADRVDFNGDGIKVDTSTSLDDRTGDTYPEGTALTNRSFRFLAEPRFPTGTELDPSLAVGCDQSPTICTEVGPHSMLRLPGINPLTGENLIDDAPLAFDVYASESHDSTKAFDAFNVMTNFRDPGDDGVKVYGLPDLTVDTKRANQNGVVFFPGSSALYVNSNTQLAGGFGVSGDGVDQDDVVTFAGQNGFEPTSELRVDAYTIGGVRVPYQKFNRNPFGA
ncbi:hypothetical protein RSSM_02698 [Rhodopirellula sallentina SM41]|uniref:Dockerin domain-containing protein n=2 Tax=Rhodopirellula TaxID=265488 RepID=M5UDD7_9BACT|nr:hypothetical protein RSSM_02698 [Rhodopirellula sallentina SM41]